MNLDKALDELGQFGKFQITIFFLLSFSIYYAAIAGLSYVFTSGDLVYRCLVPECEDVHGSYQADWLSKAIPYENDKMSRCERYEPIETHLNDTCTFNNTSIIRCHEWIFETQEYTIVKEWNITCKENQWKVTIVGTINYIGQFVGFPVAGYFSDRIGRKSSLLASILLTTTVGLLRPAAWNYEVFLFFEFILAVLSAGIYNSGFVLGLELVNPKTRVITGSIISSFYALGMVFLAAGAMWLQNWRLLHALYVPGLLCILYYWFLPESVRWLAAKGRNKEVEDIMLRAAKCNGVQFSDEARYKNEMTPLRNPEKPEAKPKSSARAMKQVLTSRILLTRLINCAFCWITNSFVYIGLSLSAVSVGGNKYTNFMLVALVEMPAYAVTPYFADRLGRKRSLCGSLLLAGICCIAFAFVSADLAGMRLAVFLLGKFAITVSFTVVYVFTAELFPTELRHSLLGICAMVGRVGSIIAPQTPLLRNIFESLPFFLFGGISITSGMLILLVPETLNTKLPDTVEEAENIGKSSNTVEEFDTGKS